jgi:hypothetical protein|tara:strand:+ start:151 stop:582 length:432 start_codon:yes stop_codon:yes gene_type:complete
MTLRTGYGTGLFSAAKYGLPQVYEGAVSAVITSGVSASARRLQNSSVSDSISSTTTSAGILIKSGAVLDSITTSVSVIGYTTIVGNVSDTITSGVNLYWNRIKSFAASDNVQVGTSVNSRYKWTNSPEPTTSWTEADYLERAA